MPKTPHARVRGHNDHSVHPGDVTRTPEQRAAAQVVLERHQAARRVQEAADREWMARLQARMSRP